MPGSTDYFRELWNDCEGFAELCTISGSRVRSRSFAIPKDLDRFVSEARKSDGQTNVYYGLALRGAPRPLHGKRFGREDVRVVSCVWADVDLFQRVGGKYKPRYELPYPELKERIHQDIQEISRRFPPSISIWSGGGYQIVWLLKEPIILQNDRDEERYRIEAINHAIETICSGDAVFNLDRVFRVPDTANIKGLRPGQPEGEDRCRIAVWHPERRYDLSDFHEALPVEASLKHIRQGTKGLPAEPAELEAVDLYELRLPLHLIRIIRGGQLEYQKFRRETDAPEDYEKREKNGKLSRSEADAYVVMELLANGVESDQIWSIFRDPANKIGEKLAERGPDYLSRTIESARQKVETREKKEPPPKLKISIERYKASKRLYNIAIELPDTTEATANTEISTLWHYDRFRMAFWDQTGRMLPRMRQPQWEKMLDHANLKEIEASVDARTEDALQDFLEEWLSEAIDDPDAGALQYSPGYSDERQYFKLRALQRQLANAGIEITRPRLCRTLKDLGWEDSRMRTRGGRKRLWNRRLKAESNGSSQIELNLENKPTDGGTA